MAVLKTAAIKTLGCKLNQFESEQMRRQLAQAGYEIVPFDARADLYIINSCTVTSRTDRDCRRLARGVKRRNPQARLIVTGCYAEVAPQRLRQIEAIDIVVGNAGKAHISEIAGLGAASATEESTDELYGGTGPMIEEFVGHTRAFIKVQEGCDRQCAYCIITHARGPSRSVPMDQVLAQARLLAQAGHPELVLVGTNLGQYGADLDDGTNLPTLLRRLADMPTVRRLRLSSLHPPEITDEIIQLVAAGGRCLGNNCDRPAAGKVCRHLHISLQSGSDSVLARMNRPYSAQFFADLIGKIKSAEPAVSIGADVIVGFPGETEQEFEQTRRLIEQLPLSYLHVFTFSPRPGTAAADMPNQIQGQVKKERNHIMRHISAGKRQQFAQTMVDKTFEAVVERFAPPDSNQLQAITDNYLQVVFAGAEELQGEIVRLRAVSTDGEIIQGHL